LLDQYQRELIHIISFCRARGEQELTPSDLTYQELPVETLDRLSQRYAVADIYPLTPMQESMLFLALNNDASPVFFEQASYRLLGKLDVDLVEKSLALLSKRYEVSRTAFVHDGLDRPLQILLKKRDIEFHYQYLRQGPAGLRDAPEVEAFIREYRKQDRERRFDLSRDALMRTAILQLDEGEYELVWSNHHIIMDGWCRGLLIAEFFDIYHHYLENKPLKLPAVTPYRHYIQWLEKKDKKESEKYWRGYLELFEKTSSLPKNPHSAPGDNPAANDKNDPVLHSLSSEQTRALHRLAGQNHVTLNTTIQAVWGILLAKLNGCRDMVFGTVVSGRPSDIPGVESMIGLFLNTIPVRIRYEKETTFKEMLQHLQKTAIESEPHHHYPLAEIQSQTRLKQHLLDHLFTFENYPLPEQVESRKKNKKDNDNPLSTKIEFNLSGFDFFEQTNYDLNILVIPGERLVVAYNYQIKVYEKKLIEEIAADFERLLLQVINNDTLVIENLTLLSAENREDLLAEFNDNLENE
jgi:hypothetical protein